MYPIGSNGASQAILDAESLADKLAATDDVVAALQAYDDERRPATASIVLMNRADGPEQVMQLAEERAPDGFADVHDIIPRQELEDIAARYKQIAGFSVEQVNRRSGGAERS
jgi:2-polyprenyl-6-methoxyphenol hydroxylase-like FAD-dependent oxidoreductase